MAASWPTEAVSLDGEQRRLAGLRPPLWQPSGPSAVAGCFLAFARGEEGPGHAGDRGWAAAAVIRLPDQRLLDTVVVPCVVGAPYDPGRLALREGPALEAAVRALRVSPDVLMVDATGRDHPREAGLALHLGARLGLPTVGVTHRPLLALGDAPRLDRGSTTPLVLGGGTVGAWVTTQAGVRPLAVHAAWRTDVATAVELVLACVGRARTPEPLRQARAAARTARAHAEGRTAPDP